MKLKNKIFIVSVFLPLTVLFAGCTTRYVNINEALSTSEAESKGTLVNRNENIEEEYEKLALYEADADKNKAVEEETKEEEKVEEAKKEDTSSEVKEPEADKKEEDKKAEDDKKEDDKKDEKKEEEKEAEETKPEETKPEEEEIPEAFDAEFYASTYPDVVNAFGNSPEALYKHYKDYGKAEGRCANAEEYARVNEATTE